MRARQSNPKIVARYGGLTNDRGQFNGTVRPMHESLGIPLRVRKPTTWAVWNDLFHKGVSDEFIAAAFGVMAATPHHTYVVLTKRPARMREWFEWVRKDRDGEPEPDVCLWHYLKDIAHATLRQCGLAEDTETMVGEETARPQWPLPNLILGTTVEDQKAADERISLLLQTPAARRVVSYEPALGAVDFSPYLGDLYYHTGRAGRPRRAPSLDWIICGAESGRNARETKDDWLRQVRDQCQEAGVPFFLKQMQVDGRLVKMPELDGKRWAEFPG